MLNLMGLILNIKNKCTLITKNNIFYQGDANEEDIILLVTEKGYGKQTKVREFRQTKRGSKGVKALNITDKNGILVNAKVTNENQDLILITNSGMTMRMPLEQINVLGRVTQGVRLMNLKQDQKVATISLVDKEAQNEESIQQEDIVSAENQRLILK